MAIPGLILYLNDQKTDDFFKELWEQNYKLRALRILVCDYYRITKKDFLRKKKKRTYSDARQIYMALAKNILKGKWKDIMFYANKKNHSSISHAKELCKSGMPLANDYRNLEVKLIQITNYKMSFKYDYSGNYHHRNNNNYTNTGNHIHNFNYQDK